MSHQPDMKTGSKKLGLVLGGAMAALLLLVIMAMTSPVQTWIARRVLATHPELHASVEKVSVGLGRVTLNNVQTTISGAVLTLPRLEAELPVFAAAWSREISVSKLVARGWTLDLTGYDPALALMAPSAPARSGFSLISTAYAAESLPDIPGVFSGLFAQLQLPVDLTLNGTILEGQVILPTEAGQPALKIQVSVLGGGLQAGHEGVFNLTAQCALDDRDAPVNLMKLEGTLHAFMDSPRTFSKLAADLNSQAVGPAFPQGVQLSAQLSAGKVNGGEDYALTLQSVGKRLLDAQANFPTNASRIGGVWRMDMRDTDVAPFVLGRPLPTFEAVGAGMFETDATFGEIHTAGRIKTALSRLETALPALAEVGALTVFSEFDLTQRDRIMRLDKLSIDINSPAPVLGVQSLQPFEFNFATGELKVANPAGDLLAVNIQGVPVEWSGALLDGIVLRKGWIKGRLVASARDGGIKVHTTDPLRVSGLSVATNDGLLSENLDMALQLVADYNPQGWQATVTDFKAGSGGVDVMFMNLRAGRMTGVEEAIKATGGMRLALAPVSRQPFARDSIALTQGEMAAEFALTLGAVREVQGKASLTGLVDTAGTVLPDIKSTLRATMQPNGEIALNLPLAISRIDPARTSDVAVEGTLTPETAGYRIDARLTGKRAYLEDLQLLAGLAAAPNVATEDGTAPGDGEEPFWAGLSGVVDLALERLSYDEQFELTDVAGSIRIDAGSLQLDEVRAGMGETGVLKADGAMNFDAQMRKPYGLKAGITAREFDSAALFKAYNPAGTAQVDGRFDFSTTVESQGYDPVDLLSGVQGDVRLTSTGGVFRLLSSNVASQVENAGKVAAVGAFLGNVASVLGKNKDAAGIANKAQAVAEFSQLLTAIKYDQLNVAVTRGDELHTRLQNFSLIAPEMRLTGDGQLTHQDDLDFMHQPLALELELKARGRTAEILRYLDLLSAEKDDLGYAVCTLPLRVGGTLLNPDTSELKSALVKLAVEQSGAGDLLNRLLGK